MTSARDRRPLAALLDAFERAGTSRAPRAIFEAAIGDDARRAIEASGWIARARDAETLPCAHGGECARQVRAIEESATERPRLVAICGKTPPECDPCDVSARDVAMARFDAARVVEVVRRVFAIDAAPAIRARSESRGAREPVRIGAQPRSESAGGARDAFFAGRPEAEISSAWMALRERAARPAIVFVPTLRRVDPELAARHGDGDRVELVALEDALGVEGDAIVARKIARLRVVRPAVPEAREEAPVVTRSVRDLEPRPRRTTRADGLRKTRDLDLPPIRKWRDLQICLLDGETIRIDGAGKYVTCTAHDLGFASTKGNRRLLREWEIVTRTCVGEGLLDWPAFDRRWPVARKYVSNVGIVLQRLFGIDETPFEEPRDSVYRAKFRAREGVPKGW